ncbi:MAG: hypothetical protein ACREMA_11005 [Longimicrobiales bacterium]
MNRQQLIDAITSEIDRIWGDVEREGDFGEYEWLLANYGITEHDDVDWLGILNHESGEIDPDDAENPEYLAWVADDARVIPFLHQLLQKYQSNTVIAPTDILYVTRRIDRTTGEEIREEWPRSQTD